MEGTEPGDKAGFEDDWGSYNNNHARSKSKHSHATGNHDIKIDDDFHKFCKTHTFRLACAISVFIVIAYILGRFDVSWPVLVILCIVAIWQWHEKLLTIQGFAYREAEINEHRKKALENAETVEWLNFFLNRWWVFSDRSVFQLLKNALDPTLESCKPNMIDSIEITDFTLGTRTPFVKFVKVFDTTEDLRKIMADEVVFRHPPNDLAARPKYQVVIDADIALDAPESKFVLHTKLRVGTTDVSVEGFRIRGRMQLQILFNQNIPFPHIAAVSFCFLKQPKFNFQVRLLKRIQLMEYPLIRQWISNLVSDSLKYTLVDPGHVTIPLCSDPEVLGRRSGYACGVLTVTIKGGSKGKQNEDERWCSITLNKQKLRTKEMGVDVVWQDTVSLFVDSIQYDKLHIKVKAKRRFGPNYTVVEYVLPLVRINILQDTIQDLDLEDKNIDGSFLKVHLEYTELALLDCCNETDNETFDKAFPKESPPEDLAGVLFVRVHKGSKLIPMDPDGLSDPYVMIFANKELVHISHVIEDTLNPEWDTMTEFYTADYTQTTLSFIINDRNPVMFSTTARADDNDDFMGSCNLAITQDDWIIFKRDIDVFFKLHSKAFTQEGAEDPNRAGSICVSVLFRPVPSLLKTVKPTKNEGFPEGESLVQKHTKMDAVTMEALLSAERGSLTLKLHRARNLAAMDFNGKSDPFVVVRIGQAKMEKYRSKICYRTLNPVWNEEVTFAMPESHQRVFIEIWDKDPFTNEKMGHVSFDHRTLENIPKQKQSVKEWYTLKSIKTGEIQMSVVVNLPDKAKDTAKKKQPTVKAYSLTSNDYIMLDFQSDSEEQPVSPEEPVSSSPDSNSSEMEEIIRSQRLSENGSPMMESRRVVVSSANGRARSASSRKARCLSEPTKPVDIDEKEVSNEVFARNGTTPNLTVPCEQTEPDGSLNLPVPNKGSSDPISIADGGSEDPLSPVVKESGIVDLSQDPTKYYGLKGVILGLKGMIIPAGINNISVRMRLDKFPQDKLKQRRASFFSSPFVLCKTDALPIEEISGINQTFSSKADQGFSPVTYLNIEVKDDKKDNIDSGSITLSNLLKGENPARRVVDLENGGQINIHISYEDNPKTPSRKRFANKRYSMYH